MTYLNYLNTFSDLLDRLEFLNDTPFSATESNAENYTELDARIALCNPSHYDLKKGYEPFLTKCQPVLSEIEKEFIVKHRINRVDNNLARGFYADVLCNAQDKPNGKLASVVITCYLEVIRKHNEYKLHDMRYIVCSIVYNSMKFQVMKDIVKTCINEYIASDTEVFEKFRCLIMCYKYDLFTFSEFFESIIQNKLIGLLSEDYFTNRTFYTTLLKNLDKENDELLPALYLQLAHNEDKLLNRTKYSAFDSNSLLNKYEYLRNAGCHKEAQIAYEAFLDAKNGGQGIHSFTKTFTLPKQYFQYDINRICQSVNPIATIACDDSILPDSESPEIDIFEDFRRLGITIHFFDNNGNPHIKDDYDKHNHTCIGFGQSYTIKTITPIMISLQQLINKGQFSFDSIYSFLGNTWLSEPRQPVNPQLRESQESWLDNIIPSLRLLCIEITKDIVTQHQYKADYVCAIDSLTMKLEGCIRDICRRRKIPTVTADKHNEILLEKLLEKVGQDRNSDGSPLINPRTYKLLMYVLTKQGYNLRNNIAHGFTSKSDYNLQNAIMVLHCMLRISAIKI